MLNRGCACISVDHEALRCAIEEDGQGGRSGLSHAGLRESRPHLFSDTMVFVSEAHLRLMAAIIESVERVVALPAYQDRVLAYGPESARYPPGAAGAFLGYDFHLGADGPQLIEINTNAGGGLLNTRLLRAQRACCAEISTMVPPVADIEQRFVEMFRQEWALAGKAGPLKRIAIVDETPAAQFLAPEFELFRQLFEANGIAAVVADPQSFSFDGTALFCAGQPVDLVYNRLTDFALDEPAQAALRAAYLSGSAVLTPHPRAHALYADKRNLTALTDDVWLASAGVTEADRAVLRAGIPHTEVVTPDAAEAFWASRKQWFFKPAAGFGSKAAYRGDKLTKRVFAEIAAGGYIAQALVPPSGRHILVEGVAEEFKLDLRNYVYRGEVQLVSARLYQGQTTNFRTPGGGFAAVFPVPCQGQEELCQ